MDAAKNFAKGTVDGLYDDTATSIDLIVGDAARFPAVPFNAVWWNATDYADPADDPNREIIRVTAIATNTLTITRAQEGTSALTHEIDGKLYRLIAGITADLITNHMLPVNLVSGDHFVDIPGALSVAVEQEALIKMNGANAMLLITPAGRTGVGDVLNENTGAAFVADDSTGFAEIRGLIATNQSQTATVGVGTIAKKIEVFDLNGTSLGFIPVYATIA